MSASVKVSTPASSTVLLPKRKNLSLPAPHQTTDCDDESEKEDNNGFQKPNKFKRFKTNFVKLLERKVAATIPTSNTYDPISDSDSKTEPSTQNSGTNT